MFDDIVSGEISVKNKGSTSMYRNKNNKKWWYNKTLINYNTDEIVMMKLINLTDAQNGLEYSGHVKNIYIYMYKKMLYWVQKTADIMYKISFEYQ